MLDATRVLTAAHCVVAPGQTAPRPVSTLTVMAGFTDTTTWGGGPPPAGTQVSGVASVRVHPLYDEQTKTDDVAVLALAQPLNLAGPRVKPIALAPMGGGPAPGAALGFSGYGAQVEGRIPDGKLYGAALTAVSDDQCRPNMAVNASASVQCVAAGNQASCFGDSGGPLTAAGLQVGVASYAPLAGCARGPSGFADVTAPEVRAFIDGAATIPVAPRQSDPVLLYSVNPPVHGSPLTCAPGTWTNGPAFGYTFVNDATGQALQAGASPRFVPAAAHRGAPVACVVTASNAGGTSTARSGTTAAVQPDLVRAEERAPLRPLPQAPLHRPARRGRPELAGRAADPRDGRAPRAGPLREGQEAPPLHQDAPQAVRGQAREGHDLPRDGVARAAREGHDPGAGHGRRRQPPPPDVTRRIRIR